jgi:hypothetical protein
MDGIFISYRRDDSAGYAGRLYDRLAAHFGAERVFMDVEGIEPGLDFVDAIEEAVGSCRVLIAVIGDEWTTATDAAGRRRLDDPNDFIRLETGSALQRGIRVVPVLVGGAVMPLPGDLPDDLKALTRRQAIEINHKQWEASTGELIHTLEGILKAPSADPAPKDVQPKDLTPADSGLGGKGAANGGKTKPVPDEQGRGDGTGKRWILPAAAVLALLAGVGLWLGQGERKPATAPEAPLTGKPAEVPVAKPPRPLARVERAPVPEEKPPILPAPSPPAAAPAPVVKPESRPAATVPAPLIREFKAEAAARLARLCYRVSDAESLSLSPRPGELRNLTEDCVEVRIDGPTNFTLLARNGGKSVRKMLAVAPLAATAAAQPETPGAAAGQPVAAGRSVAVLPVKGERWVYKASGKWPTSFRQRFEIVVQSVADSLVTDEFRVLDGASGPEQRRSRGSKPDFVAWTAIGMEFSPYFGAYVDLARQESLGSLPTPDYDPQWRDWHSKVEVLGRESVSVPAGTFDAFKVEVWSNRRQTGSPATLQVEPVRVRYTIWYAPQVKRYVRMQRTVVSANNSEIEKDLFELVAYRGP